MSSRPNRRSGGASGPYRGGKGVHGGREGRPEGHRSQNQQATEASEPKKWQQEPSNHAGYIKQLFEKRAADVHREIQKQKDREACYYRGLLVLSTSRKSKDVQASKDLTQMLGVSKQPSLLERLSKPSNTNGEL